MFDLNDESAAVENIFNSLFDAKAEPETQAEAETHFNAEPEKLQEADEPEEFSFPKISKITGISISTVRRISSTLGTRNPDLIEAEYYRRNPHRLDELNEEPTPVLLPTPPKPKVYDIQGLVASEIAEATDIPLTDIYMISEEFNTTDMRVIERQYYLQQAKLAAKLAANDNKRTIRSTTDLNSITDGTDDDRTEYDAICDDIESIKNELTIRREEYRQLLRNTTRSLAEKDRTIDELVTINKGLVDDIQVLRTFPELKEMRVTLEKQEAEMVRMHGNLEFFYEKFVNFDASVPNLMTKDTFQQEFASEVCKLEQLLNDFREHLQKHEEAAFVTYKKREKATDDMLAENLQISLQFVQDLYNRMEQKKAMDALKAFFGARPELSAALNPLLDAILSVGYSAIVPHEELVANAEAAIHASSEKAKKAASI